MVKSLSVLVKPGDPHVHSGSQDPDRVPWRTLRPTKKRDAIGLGQGDETGDVVGKGGRDEGGDGAGSVHGEDSPFSLAPRNRTGATPRTLNEDWPAAVAPSRRVLLLS